MKRITAVLACLVSLAVVLAAPAGVAAAGIESSAPYSVQFDSSITQYGSYGGGSGEWNFLYTSKVIVAREPSGTLGGAALGTYDDASGTISDGGTDITATGGTGAPFDVIRFDPGDQNTPPSIVIDPNQPTEHYHASDSSGYSYDYDDHVWVQWFDYFNHPQNGLVTFPLTRVPDPGPTGRIATGEFLDSITDGASEGTQINVYACEPFGPAGEVTFSAGDAPPLHSPVCDGDTVSTGADGRVEITFKDGSIVRLGRSSKVKIDEAAFSNEPKITLKLILGLIWSKIAARSDVNVDIANDAAGVRGAGDPGGASDRPSRAAPALSGMSSTSGGGSFVFSDPAEGDPVYHQISGEGFAQPQGNSAVSVRPGWGVIFGANGLKLTPKLPTGALSVVPAGDLPPTIASLKISGATAGQKPNVGFQLDQAAPVTLVVRAGRRTLFRQSLKAKHGPNSVTLEKALKAGRYTLELDAVRSGLTAIALKAFTVG